MTKKRKEASDAHRLCPCCRQPLTAEVLQQLRDEYSPYDEVRGFIGIRRSSDGQVAFFATKADRDAELTRLRNAEYKTAKPLAWSDVEGMRAALRKEVEGGQ